MRNTRPYSGQPLPWPERRSGGSTIDTVAGARCAGLFPPTESVDGVGSDASGVLCPWMVQAGDRLVDCKRGLRGGQSFRGTPGIEKKRA
jgi:hypothetical protein